MLTQTARDVIEGAFIPLWVRGEVSDFKAHRNGHWYFCLRDRTAQIRCVVWSRDQRGIPAPPDDGMQVVAFGRLTVYAARGEMQFTVTRIEAEGDGLRRKALERTRARLEADGLLAPERKRRAAALSARHRRRHEPRRRRAARHRRGDAPPRAANVRLVVVPAKVQGDGAPLELCAALDRVNRWGKADLVIIGRGGGAREDLWAFNDERVARAVAACRVPTISAVGHEVDISICDLVADLPRADAVGRRGSGDAVARRAAERVEKSLIAHGGRPRARIVRHRADELRHLERDVASASAELVAAPSRRSAGRRRTAARAEPARDAGARLRRRARRRRAPR